jgi:peptide/nickel transport system permease protein
LGNALQLDFGESLWLRRDALGAVIERLPATFMLAGLATGIGTILGVAAGALAARREGSKLDRFFNVGSYAIVSIAEFWLAIMAILVFALYLGLVPTSGYTPKPAVLILPVSVLALRPMGRLFQMTRATMLTEYDRQYVMTARAKGVSEGAVGRVHVLHNAAIPIVTLAFYELSRVFVGSAIIIEVVFAWPGLGRLAVNGLERGDVFLIQAVVAVAAIAAAGLNLIADLLYFVLDPRTRSLVKEQSA